MKIRKYAFIPLLLLLVSLMSSCDEHEDIDHTIHVGYVLLDNFDAMPLEEYQKNQSRQAIGVVFAEKTTDHPVLVVSLREIGYTSFADSLYSQGTSCSIEAFDGNRNTISLQSSYDEKTGHGSPLADYVFYTYPTGHSYAIPSVAEMRLMVSVADYINPVIESLNGDKIRNHEQECWYWTSTEVAENRGNQAWTVSAANGSWMQMAKFVPCRSRAIITLNH